MTVLLAIEDRVEQAMHDNLLRSNDQDAVHDMLWMIQAIDENTYLHSLRVGLLVAHIGRYLQTEKRPLFLAGLTHDVGKARIPIELLKRRGGISADEMRIMENHAMHGYNILRDFGFDLTAEIVVRVHTFQPNPYPKVLPNYTHGYSDTTKNLINIYARLVALADFYDAASTRPNTKFPGNPTLTTDEIRSIVVEHNPDVADLVRDLYKNRVLGDGFFRELLSLTPPPIAPPRPSQTLPERKITTKQ
jgi:putative nucleotidyltransferase with HDIG domain